MSSTNLALTTSNLDPPTHSAGDHVHSAVRGLVGLLPFSSIALEFFNTIIAPPLEKRRQKWMEDVAEAVRELEGRGIKAEDLKQNESFVSTFMQASLAAMRNHEQEKIDALRNAVLNAALPCAPDESMQQIFLGWVERMTVWHLRILAFLDNPPLWFKNQNQQFPDFSLASLNKILIQAYPELANKREFYDLIAKDLWNNGLLNTDGLHGMMSDQGLKGRRTSEIGKKFLGFITAPTR
jgi:hypothetical protein